VNPISFFRVLKPPPPVSAKGSIADEKTEGREGVDSGEMDTVCIV